MFRFLMTILKSRTTWRFLLLLAGTIGATGILSDLSTLESLVCTVLTCSD